MTNKKPLSKKIEELIQKEKNCMLKDDYKEQEIEHLNQIEMANKIKPLVAEAVEELKRFIDDDLEFCNRDGSNKKNPYTIYEKLIKEIEKIFGEFKDDK